MVLENLPVAVVACGADGGILQYNRKAAELFGTAFEPGERFDQAVRLLRPDGGPVGEADGLVAELLRTGQSQRDVELFLDRPPVRRVHLLANLDPITGGGGAICCFTDVTGYAKANRLRRLEPSEQRYRELLELLPSAADTTDAENPLVDLSDRKLAAEYANRLASIVEFSDDAIVSKNLDGVINSWNAGAQRLFGYTAEETIGNPIYMLIPPERHDEEPGILDRIRRGERIDHYETVRRRKDGSLVDISLTVSPLKNADGKIIGASKIARDISDRKREEERRKLLRNELNHRVKNTLASVQSIAAQTFRGKSGYPSKEFEERLVALSRAHDILTRESWEGADLRELATQVIAPLCIDHGNRVGILGPTLRLRPKVALSLSMAFHELCTNAMKHGALGQGQGRVDLGWSVHNPRGENWFRIRWEETGGPPVKPPSCRGFGTQLLERGVARELGAQVQLSFLPSGVVCEIEAPLE